jgi:hypothetical protein
MGLWVWLLVGIVVILGLAVSWWWYSKRRTDALKNRFGTEYRRSLAETQSRRRTEAELSARQARHNDFDIRPLSPAEGERYSTSWGKIQGQFVDDPSEAVREADRLLSDLMRDRGYPMADFGQRSADVSVDMPHLVDEYRAAHGISMANDHGKASTEDLRQAFVHYRSLFDELLVTDSEDEQQTG